MEARAVKLLLAGLILAGPAAQAESARDHLPTYGGAAQHYGEPRRSHRRPEPVTLPQGFFQGSGGVGGQPAASQTYVFYGVPFPRPRPLAGGFANARAVSQVQVRVDGR